jgi:uncharacterized alpha-E superfamily protein
MSAGMRPAFEQKHSAYTARTVSEFMLRDRENPSSVLSALASARTNARMVRTALTRDVWESVNGAWIGLSTLLDQPVAESDLPQVLDAIKRAMSEIRGTFHGTMLRNEIFWFSQLGTFIERADSTARILDVKYYVLLPTVSYVGRAMDNYQWESILRSVSAHRSYRFVYSGNYNPVQIAEYLILDARMPRALRFSYDNIDESLTLLAEAYGQRFECHDGAQRTLKSLAERSIQSIFEAGLHEALTAFITENNRLGAEIARVYNFE